MKTLVLFCGLLIAFYTNAQTSFPAIEGWTKSDKINTYNSESLWEYINGAASYYLGFGFEKLEWIEYSVSDDVYIKAEVYTHSSHINTFGIYAYERTPEASFLTVGCEGYLIHSTLNFYADNYYVKIHSHSKTPETIEAIKNIASKLASSIAAKAEQPAELNVLNNEDRIAYSEKYKTANYMGYSFLERVVSAKYTINEQEVEFFSIKHQSDEEAINNLKEYLQFLKTDMEVKSGEIYELDDIFNGKIFMAVKDQYLIGVTNAKDKSVLKKLSGL